MGVVRKETGTVHFFVNGIDQGAAASNVPENVYGVIDLYGQAAQATIVDQSGLYIGELNLIKHSPFRPFLKKFLGLRRREKKVCDFNLRNIKKYNI